MAVMTSKREGDKLFRHGLIVLFVFHFGSIANLVFQYVTGRALSKAEFGILYSMLSFLLVFMIPMRALQTTISHFAGHLHEQGRTGDILRLVRLWNRKLIFVGLPIALAGILLSGPLSSLFHLPNAWPLVLVFSSALMFAFLQVYVGAFQGIQSFTLMCLVANGWNLVRLGIVIVLVHFVAPLAISGLAAHLAGSVFVAIAGFLMLKRVVGKEEDTGEALDETDRYFILSVLALLAFSILMNGDVALVKIYFSEEVDYGDYARASLIGRMIVFLVQPVAMALFPKVVAKGIGTSAHRRTLMKAIIMSGAMIAVAIAFCMLFPRLPLTIIFGEMEPDARSVSLLRLIALGMAPLALSFVLLNYELAQHRFRFMIPLACCAALYVGGVMVFHDTIWNVAVVFCCAGWASLALLLTDTVLMTRKMRDEGCPSSLGYDATGPSSSAASTQFQTS